MSAMFEMESIGPEPEPVAASKSLTERDVLDLLWTKYARDVYGNGPRYAFAEHVRNGAGFDATRTFDAVAVDFWPASGLQIHIFEVKVARSDWLRELKDPTKAQAAIDLGDTFSVVAPAGVVKPEELPSGWGWHIASEKGITVRRAAVPHDLGPFHSRQLRPPVPRSFLVPLLRAAVKTANRTTR